MLFPANFVNKEQARTSLPGFPLLALGFLFSELKCLTCCLARWATRWAALGTQLWALTFVVQLVLWCLEEVRCSKTETSSWPGVSVPALSILVPA